jgi:hypothetical protein
MRPAKWLYVVGGRQSTPKQLDTYDQLWTGKAGENGQSSVPVSKDRAGSDGRLPLGLDPFATLSSVTCKIQILSHVVAIDWVTGRLSVMAWSNGFQESLSSMYSLAHVSIGQWSMCKRGRLW